MNVGLNDLTYVPTIYLRPAELSALEHLSNADKDRIIPIVLLKPWANAKTLAQAVLKIEGAFEKRRYFLAWDDSYTREAGPSAASIEYEELRSSYDGFAKWWSFVEERSNVIPYVPLGTEVAENCALLEKATTLGRGFLVRITRRSGQLIRPIVEALKEVDHNEYLVCVDVGWGRDILSAEMWADTCVKALVAVNEQVKIVVSGSSFPSEFTRITKAGEEAALERLLYANLVKRNNQAKLIYGDWGSSRASLNGGGGVIVPRVDVPMGRSWYIFRADSTGTYRTTAKEAMESGKWPYDPDVWGKYVIRNTSIGQGYVIDSPKKSTEVRINIHLHEQISGDSPPDNQYVEEDFTD